MIYIIIGIAGFIVIHAFDILTFKKKRLLKPAVNITGGILSAYLLTILPVIAHSLSLPAWVSISGWILLSTAFVLSLTLCLPTFHSVTMPVHKSKEALLIR